MQMTNKRNGKRPQNQTASNMDGNLPAREKIQARAHEIYLARGAQPGHELDDWLQAEQEIMMARVWV